MIGASPIPRVSWKSSVCVACLLLLLLLPLLLDRSCCCCLLLLLDAHLCPHIVVLHRSRPLFSTGHVPLLSPHFHQCHCHSQGAGPADIVIFVTRHLSTFCGDVSGECSNFGPGDTSCGMSPPRTNGQRE